MGAAALPSFDPFQDNSPLLGNNDDDHDTRGISDIVNVPVQVKQGFVNPIADDDNNEDNDEFYLRQEEDDDIQLNVNIQFGLTTLKPLHSKWLLEFYNHITSETGAEIISNGWKAAGVYDALKMGWVQLPYLLLIRFRIIHPC